MVMAVAVSRVTTMAMDNAKMSIPKPPNLHGKRG